jgi:hypothetical protein
VDELRKVPAFRLAVVRDSGPPGREIGADRDDAIARDRDPDPVIANPLIVNHLTACSVCLRVLRGTEWVEAERAIRDLRSFALPAPPRFDSALCDHCTDSIDRRRREPKETLAA